MERRNRYSQCRIRRRPHPDQEGATVLLRESGNDLLSAGKGRSILIGSPGNDDLNGDKSDSILVDGTTNHDESDRTQGEILEL